MVKLSQNVVAGCRPQAFCYPYIIHASFKDKDKVNGTEEFEVWKCNGQSTKPTLVSTLQGEFPAKHDISFLTNRFLLTTSRLPDHVIRLLIHRVGDGALTDVMTLTGASGERLPSSFPNQSQVYYTPVMQAGDSTLLGFSEGLIAVLRIGATLNALDTVVEVYGVTDDGKLVKKNVLRLVHDHSLGVSWIPTTWEPPALVLLYSTQFIGAVALGTDCGVHLMRWDSDSGTNRPGHARFPPRLSVDANEEDNYTSILRSRIVLSPPFNAFLMAHSEGLAVENSSPYTTLRSVDTSTLEVNWCNGHEQDLLSLEVHEELGMLLMFGRDQVTLYVTILDLRTGSILRREGGDISSGLVSVRVSLTRELILVKDNGSITILLLPDFVRYGYALTIDDSDGSEGSDCNSDSSETSQLQTESRNQHVVASIPPLDLNRTMAENIWVGSTSYGGSVLLIGDEQGARYYLFTWK